MFHCEFRIARLEIISFYQNVSLFAFFISKTIHFVLQSSRLFHQDLLYKYIFSGGETKISRLGDCSGSPARPLACESAKLAYTRNFSIDRRARLARSARHGESRCPRVSIPITPSPSASPRERDERSVIAVVRDKTLIGPLWRDTEPMARARIHPANKDRDPNKGPGCVTRVLMTCNL